VVVAAANRTCQASNSSFINHMGTNNAARDLDRLRAAVGDRKLTYWGLSYGTRIGYVYALMYPNRIRAMTLDGNIDPKSNYAGLTQGGVALDSALRFMAASHHSLCGDHGDGEWPGRCPDPVGQRQSSTRAGTT
jgi:pimeloyl-ACP methyl ester carboxylesterase